jgi:type IV fimbrial biogenesis protein FimT
MPAISISPPVQRGFTLIEALVTLVIFSILLAIGVPAMSTWMLATKAASATELYAEGIKMARQQALTHNAYSRLLLSQNINGQLDWKIDICFQVSVSCTDGQGNWSTINAPASDDPEPAVTAFRSVVRSASGLPTSEVLQPIVSPAGSVGVYFTPLGWVDSSITTPLSKIIFQPAASYGTSIRASAVVVTLAGAALKCDPSPTLAAGDSRACP